MSQRSMLLLSGALTAFVLIVVGALAGGFGRGASAPAGGDAAPDTAAYQRQLDQANARLEQANRQLQDAYRRQQELTRQLQAQQTQPDQAAQPPAAPQGLPSALTAQQAAEVARRAVPGATLLALPELVELQGTPAYEVRLDQGLVYVDAGSGQILSSELPLARGGRSGREHHERGGRLAPSSSEGDDDD